MPVVPFTSQRPNAPGVANRQLPDEPFALMAAAQMHAEGRLVEKDKDNGKEPNRS